MDSSIEKYSSRRLTEKILKDFMGKRSKSNTIAVESIARLHHEVMVFNRDHSLNTVDESTNSVLDKMEYFEGKCFDLFKILDGIPQFSSIVPCLDDIWSGYQLCAKRMYRHLKMEVDMVEAQVNTFTFDMKLFERMQLDEIKSNGDRNRESNEIPELVDSPSSMANMDQTDCSLAIELENNELREEISKLECDNSKLEQEKYNMSKEIAEMRNAIKSIELNQADLTPRPIASLDDLVEILGDESIANNANEMIQILHIHGEDAVKFIELHLQQVDTDLPPELEEFTSTWRDIVGAQCDNEALTAALVRRVGPTSQKFKFLEKKYILLQQENNEMKQQLSSFLELEEKRALARQRHDEAMHSERKCSIQRYLDMLADKGEDAWKDQLIGMGAGSDVPKLFRFVGKIRNKHMSKRDTEKLVREIWKDRSTTSSFKSTSLVDFLGNHLQKKVGIAAAVLELGYNFLYSLWRYQWDADCELFLKILIGDTREEVYIAQNNLQVDLQEMFEALDKANGVSTGYIPKEELSIALRAFFRVGKLDGKSEKRFEEALHALDVDHPGCQVEWRKIFEEDREFNQGEFAECVRDQFLIEREELYDAIGVALYEECGEDTTCSCSQVEAALIVARPTLGEKAQKCAAALFQEFGEDKLKISVALKYLSDRSLESNEEELHQGIQRKQQKSDKPGLVAGKVGRQTVVQKRQNPLIASALEEVRLFWLANTS